MVWPTCASEVAPIAERPPSDEMRALVTACSHLDAGRPQDALVALQGTASPGAEAVALLALGLVLEREGDRAAADDCVDRANVAAPALPAVLRECGRYFKRTARYARAYDCSIRLAPFDATGLREFFDDLPPAVLARYAPALVRDLVSRSRPHHWFYPPVKAALSDALGPEAAAIAFAAMAGNRPGAVVTAPLASLRDAAREHAAVYEELVAPRIVRMAPPRVVGESPGAPVDVRTRTVFFCVLRDAVVSSKSNVLVADGVPLLDHQDDEMLRADHVLDVDPIVFAPNGDAATVHVEGHALAGEPLERALPLVGVNTYNFGHWLVEFLPKIWWTQSRPGFAEVPIIVDEQMHPQLRPALELFLGRDHPVVVLPRGEAMRVRELWWCASPTYFGLSGAPRDLRTLDADALAAVIATLSPQLAEVDGGDRPKRIFLARQDTQHRRLINRRAVEAWFGDHGFDVFDPGELPFREQLARVRAADVVVGPDGSALWMAFLGGPGTRVGYLNNPILEHHWWIALLSQALGQRMALLTGPVVHANPDPMKSDYEIDLQQLPAFLDELLAG